MKNEKRLNGRDLINIGIYGAIYFAILFVVAILGLMSVMFRLFPTIREEWQSIRRAMRMRGIHPGGAKAGQVLEYQMVPMMTSSVRIGEELSASALTRGLGAPVRRTNICRIGFRLQDLFFLAGAAFVLVVWVLEMFGVSLW